MVERRQAAKGGVYDYARTGSPAGAASDDGVLTSSPYYSPDCRFHFYSGFIAPWNVGAYAPTALTGGQAVAAIADSDDFSGMCFGNFSFVTVAGFSADPGSNWLTSVACNGIANTSAAARSYSYNAVAGSATWYWDQRFGFIDIWGNVGCTVVHN